MGTRRHFIRSTSLGVAGLSAASLIPSGSSAMLRIARESHVKNHGPLLQDPRLKEFINRALDAARVGGAEYADARFAHNTEYQTLGILNNGFSITEGESISIGVRALVNKTWGFAASTVWTADEMTRLGQEAARQATVVSRQQNGGVTLAPMDQVKDGNWIMPVAIDPMPLDRNDVATYVNGLKRFGENYLRSQGAEPKSVQMKVSFFSQDKVFGSTEGSFVTQRVYRSAGVLVLRFVFGGKETVAEVDIFTPAGVGFELFLGEHIRDAIRVTVDRTLAELKLPSKPIDVGRYQMVFDASSIAKLVSRTIGYATELDRALGFEANAGGTSYIDSPREMMGAYRIGSPLLNIRANRNQPGGVATVKWDDEGVAAKEFDMIKDGVLVGFSSGRETASWLSQPSEPSAETSGIPAVSNGCMLSGTEPLLAGGSGVNAPLNHTPNLVMAPAQSSADFETLVKEMGNGIAIRNMQVTVDFQQLNGLGMGTAYDVKSGKIVSRYQNAGVLFRTPELWKNLIGLGGAQSATSYGQIAWKGEPAQMAYHTVTAVPALIKDVSIVDILRRS